jgi:hypothetical protein
MTQTEAPAQPAAAPAAARPEIVPFPKGTTADSPRVGDFILTGIKAQGIVSLAIKLGALLRGQPKEYRRYSHSALIVGEDGSIVEAVATGVKPANLSSTRRPTMSSCAPARGSSGRARPTR